MIVFFFNATSSGALCTFAGAILPSLLNDRPAVIAALIFVKMADRTATVLYKGCPEYKKQAFRQHVVNHQKSYASVVGQNSHSQPKTTQTYQFTAEQLTKFVANVAIQIAQPQVCYPNPKQDMLNLKSSMCRKVSTVAKTILGVNITGKELFESIGSLSAPAPPRPFTFTSTQVNSGSKVTSKPSTSKSTSPPKTSTKAVPKQPKSTT